MTPSLGWSQQNNALEQGSVLVIALVILLVLTMMAIAGVQSTSIQERMSGNMRDKDLSFQFAEMGLRDAELALRDDFDWVQNNATCFQPFDGPLPSDTCLHRNATFSQMEYVIRELPPIPEPSESLESDTFNLPEPSLYRITSNSTGASGVANTELESIFKR